MIPITKTLDILIDNNKLMDITCLMAFASVSNIMKPGDILNALLTMFATVLLGFVLLHILKPLLHQGVTI